MTSNECCIGVDIGGTKILGVLADPASGRILQQLQAPTPTSDASGLGSAIGDLIADLIAQSHDQNVGAIGIGLPGLVDVDGVLRYGPNVPGVLSLDIGGELEARFGLPVAVENDATNFARAEHQFGAAKGFRHAIMVTQGTGIGGALIINDEVFRGANGFAGEPGHMQVEADGYRCACGRHGCWETVSSGAGLVNLARDRVASGGGQQILFHAEGDEGEIRGEHVSAAFLEGDPEAVALVSEFANWVAVGLGGLVSLLDPEIIVLGGGLTPFGIHFIQQVQDSLSEHSVGGPFRPEVPIVSAELGPAAGAVGGALSASALLDLSRLSSGGISNDSA